MWLHSVTTVPCTISHVWSPLGTGYPRSSNTDTSPSASLIKLHTNIVTRTFMLFRGVAEEEIEDWSLAMEYVERWQGIF
jgi:hypothetical protein